MNTNTAARRHATRPDPAGGSVYFAKPTTKPTIELLGYNCGTRADLCHCIPTRTMTAAKWNDLYAYDETSAIRSHAVTTV